MTAQELKNSILQLAVQGKLVPQDKNDEPASELLKRIQAEKARLVKEGKIKKEKALPPIAEEELPFDIPESWEWVRVGDLGETQTGSTPSKKVTEFWGGHLPFVQPSNINNGVLSKTDCYLTETGIEQGRLIPPNSILQVCIGTLGKCAINYEEVSCNQQINTLTPLCCCVEFIMLAMSSGFFINNLVSESASTTIAIINKGKWEHLLLPIPPFDEQKRIVAKIEELLPLIEEYGKAETRLKELNADFPDMLRKSILQQAVQGKLTERNPKDEPASELLKRIQAEKAQLIKDGKLKKEKPLPPITEEEIPFDIPDVWEWVRIDDLYSVSTGMTPLKGEKRFYTNGTIPWITSSLTSNRYIDYAETYITEYALKNTTLEIYPKNTLIIAMYGQGKTRGQISELLIPATINQACAALVAIKTDEISNQFVYFYFQYYYNLLRKKAEGTSQPNLNLGKIRECVFPLPPLEEQKRIVARVEELLALCDGLK